MVPPDPAPCAGSALCHCRDNRRRHRSTDGAGGRAPLPSRKRMRKKTCP